jgi:uncharacterized protein (TIGR00251 family)
MAEALIPVRLGPRSSRELVGEVREGRLVVKVSAPPVDGQANAALCVLLAKRLGVPKSRVSVRRGERSRDKLIAVEGLEQSVANLTLGFA